MWTDPGSPAERVIAEEQARDHARAKERGLVAKDITILVLGALDGHGLVRDQSQARVVIFAALVDALFGNRAVDIPDLSR